MSMPAQEGLKYMRAGWLQPVDEMLKSPALTAPDYNWNDFLEKTRDAMVIEGKLMGAPIQVENTSLMYRKDVFQKYNVKVPTTLDELEAAAKALNGKAMTDDGQPGFGIVARGKRAAATSQFAAYLHAMAAPGSTPTASPLSTARTASRPSSCAAASCACTGLRARRTTTGTRPSSIFSQGKAAMYTDANSLFPVIEDAQKSKVIGKVGYAVFPKGPKGQPGSTVAAWGLGMPKTSKNQKAAWLFMQWATTKEQVLPSRARRACSARATRSGRTPRAAPRCRPTWPSR